MPSLFLLRWYIQTFPQWFKWVFLSCAQFRGQVVMTDFRLIAALMMNLSNFLFKECFIGNGRGYRGSISTTVSGYACQPWSAPHPHLDQVVKQQISEEIKNGSNSCRNPRGLSVKSPWCLISNRTVQWEYCDVPKCSTEGTLLNSKTYTNIW